MASDPAGGQVLMYGGCGLACPDRSTWEYSYGYWIPVLTGGQIPALVNASMTFLNESGAAYILFGGVEPNGTLNPYTFEYNNTSAFRNGWFRVTLNGWSPSPRQSAGFASDVSRAAGVLFGGCGSTCPLADTWIFTLTPAANWSRLAGTGSSCPVRRELQLRCTRS